MTALAFIIGAALGAFVTLACMAHRHFWAMNARSEDIGQPTYDKDGKLTGWLE